MRKERLALGASIVAVCAAVGVVGGLIGCAPHGSDSTSANNPSSAQQTSSTTSLVAAAKTMEEWGEEYPLQYNSYHQSTVKADGQLHGHYDLKQKLLAPAVRVTRTKDGQLDTKLVNEDGGYNEDDYIMVSGVEWDSANKQWVVKDSELDDLSGTRERQGCYACKSSVFDEIYNENGAAIFGEKLTDEFVSEMNGQVWTCTTCHGETPGTETDAKLTYWTQLARDTFNDFKPEERVCGQCHNSYDYRSHITDQETMDSFSPYRYGVDVDSLYDAAVEDGIYSIDEDTGILLTCFDHPDIEFNQGSAMNELGVTCIDCHMPTMTDGESGTNYTSHNASGSPLASDESLEYCLTCHKSQGIESTEDMAKMVRDLQAETIAVEEELQEKMDTAYELIKDANKNGGVAEDVLQKARDDYSKAEAYYHATVGDAPLGAKVVHNPMATVDYNARTGKLLDGIISSLG